MRVDPSAIEGAFVRSEATAKTPMTRIRTVRTAPISRPSRNLPMGLLQSERITPAICGADDRFMKTATAHLFSERFLRFVPEALHQTLLRRRFGRGQARGNRGRIHFLLGRLLAGF